MFVEVICSNPSIRMALLGVEGPARCHETRQQQWRATLRYAETVLLQHTTSYTPAMDSPVAPVVVNVEMSMIDFDGPPSSPFVTEVETQSRSPSKQWTAPTMDAVYEDEATPTQTPPSKQQMMTEFGEDKENMPQTTPNVATKPRTPSSQKLATPERKSSKANTPQSTAVDRRASLESELMPPPPSSVRKAHATPKKTPLKPSRSAANTPCLLSRGDSYERTSRDEQTISSFQAGLDVRSSGVVLTQDAPSVDDTCFSMFSEIPEMTTFAKLGQSQTRRGDMSRTPKANADATPHTTRKRLSTSRSPSPTPRKQKTPGAQNQDGTTSFLIDFTQQMDSMHSHRPTSPGKAATEPNLLQFINNQRSPHKGRQSYATPSRPSSILNLLDFELPPAPTPRSVPTITVRELESLKSSYLSQISSLKATPSGREAEVESLKRAVGDAERRVGEAQETLRDEKNRREHVEQEKAGWERRGQEVESVLQSVKEEVMKSETEKEDLLRKMDDCEKRVEGAEVRATKAEERFADALAARAGPSEGDGSDVEDQVQRLVAAQIDAKIEAVSRELHSVYKEKHERKVATLKKSYEARSEKRTAELQSRLGQLEKQHEELQAAKDATFSGPIADASAEADLKVQLEEHKAALARLENEKRTSSEQQDQLRRELEQERIEKGDLVAAVDEMLNLQSDNGPSQNAMSVVEDFRKSISRPTGMLRAPGGLGGQSRIGGPALLGRSTSGGKSRLLSNIEKMGRAGAASNASLE